MQDVYAALWVSHINTFSLKIAMQLNNTWIAFVFINFDIHLYITTRFYMS